MHCRCDIGMEATYGSQSWHSQSTSTLVTQTVHMHATSAGLHGLLAGAPGCWALAAWFNGVRVAQSMRKRGSAAIRDPMWWIARSCNWSGADRIS